MNNKYNIPIQSYNENYIHNCIFYDQYKYHDNTFTLECTRYIGIIPFGINIKIRKQNEY
jgi:hypothetical protein